MLKLTTTAAWAAGILAASPLWSETLANQGDSWVRESAPDNAFPGRLTLNPSECATDRFQI
jgi:hypothetical protein